MTDVVYDALVMGGSAGSLGVIRAALARLVPQTSLAVVVCMHTASHDVDDLCAVLGEHCALPVREALDGRRIEPGYVYVAAGGYHLLIEQARVFSLCVGERVNFSRPSIDIVFETMAEAYRERLAGMLVSGANNDGAAGLQRIRALGGHVRVQDPATAASAEMPQAALALFDPDGQNSPMELAEFVHDLSVRARRHV